MDANISQAPLDSTRLERFRMILAEYDIVATGIKTLSQQLISSDEDLAGPLLAQLQAVEQKLGLDRESMWRLQVSDDRLTALLAELNRRGRGNDPLSSLSAHLRQTKLLLSPLGHAIEATRERSHGNLAEVAPADNSEQRRKNLERVAYEVAFGRTQLASTPLRFVLDTISRCNLRCLTCYQSVTQDTIHYDLADASVSVLEPAIRQATQVFIAGMGETFLSRSAFDLIALAKSAGAYVEAITNGTTLGRGSRAIHGVDLFMVSFDGGTQDSYEAIRRNGNFNKVVESIASLSAADRRRIGFNVVVCKQNVFTMGECVDLAVTLGIGHVHLQDMGSYLAWHDRMALEDPDRAWLFDRLPTWERRAAAGGVSLICNLVRNQAPFDTTAIDLQATTRRNLDAVADVPAATLPTRISLVEASARLDAYLRSEVPDAFRYLTASLRRLLPLSAPRRTVPPNDARPGEPDWIALRDHVEADKAMFPHCLSTYAHMVVNGDGTTRSCCKVQNRLGSLSAADFDTLWNGEPYLELRTAHSGQIAPRSACQQCQDPVRFHFLPQILQVLEDHDIDITLIRKPRDFPVPASCANHPLVEKLGSNALEAAS